MGFDDFAKLKADLHMLDCHIQDARNCEVRHALQRGRLEAERAQLLVKLMDSMATLAPPSATLPEVTSSPYRIVMQEPSTPPTVPTAPDPRTVVKPNNRRSPKPDGLPPVREMITTTLTDAAKPLRPSELVDRIRKRWWASATTQDIGPVAWRMSRDGKLTNVAGRYGLVVVAHNGAGSSISTSRQ